MFTSFTQFLIIVVFLFVAAVLVVDRHEVSRFNRELVKENLRLKNIQTAPVNPEPTYPIRNEKGQTILESCEETIESADNLLKILRVLN